MNPTNAQPEDDSSLDLEEAKKAAREWKMLWAQEQLRRKQLEQEITNNNNE